MTIIYNDRYYAKDFLNDRLKNRRYILKEFMKTNPSEIEIKNYSLAISLSESETETEINNIYNTLK